MSQGLSKTGSGSRGSLIHSGGECDTRLPPSPIPTRSGWLKDGYLTRDGKCHCERTCSDYPTLSNSYTLGLSARSILSGRVNLPHGACGSGRYSGGYSGGYPHVDSRFILKTYKFLKRGRSC